jgi:hypothetical protein
MAPVVRQLRLLDSRHLYAQGTNNWFGMVDPNDDFWVSWQVRWQKIRGSYASVDTPLGHIQVGPPGTDKDYIREIKGVSVPIVFPNLWQHISGGAAYNAWFGDIFFEGENVEPTDLDTDYIEVLPAGRMRAIGSSACAGGVMTMMCQSDRHRSQWHVKHTHQFVGWVMAHDILPEQVPLYPKLCETGHLWEDDVRFLPYWKPSPFAAKQEGCLVSAHATKDRALLWVVNISRKDADVKVAVDWKAAGLDAAQTTAVHAETGAAVPLAADGFTVSVLQRDFVPVLLTRNGAK